MRIREATEADHAALCELWRQVDELHARLRPELFQSAPGLPRPVRVLGEAAVAEDQVVLLAEGQGGTPMGLVHVRLFDTPAVPQMVPRRRGHVEDLVVRAEQRRRGVGRALMAEAEQWCRRRGATQLVLTVWSGNEDAEALYDRLGYQPLSRVLGKEL